MIVSYLLFIFSLNTFAFISCADIKSKIMENLKFLKFLKWVGLPLFVVTMHFGTYLFVEDRYNLGMAITDSLHFLGFYLVGIFLAHLIFDRLTKKLRKKDQE